MVPRPQPTTPDDEASGPPGDSDDHMRILHLSDIHFGGYGPGWDPDTDQRQRLLLDLDRLVTDGGDANAVLVGGDIAYRAAPEEYYEAVTWLTEVAK